MSRDIYMYAEKRVQAAWQLAEAPELYLETAIGIETGEQWLEPRTLYHESNRSLFEVLVHHDYEPSELDSFGPPRGLPDDLSPLLRDKAQRTMAYSHTHSWLSLAELLAFDWSGKACADDFLATVLPRLQSFGTPENVRVVFWFS